MPITPTPGADAVAAGMQLVPGSGLSSDLDEYINQTRDYIAQRTNAVTPVTKGGTGAATAALARTNLDVPKSSEAVLCTSGNVIRIGWNTPSALRLNVSIDGGHVGALAYTSDIPPAPDLSGYIHTSGGTIVGSLYLPNSSPAVSNYAVAYINADGRVSRGASSERYKKYISAINPASLGDVFPDLTRFQMRTGDGTWKYGYIAERLDEHPDQQPFVVYNEDGEPDSIDFIALLMVQNAQLHETVDLLARRFDALENRS